MSNARFCPRGLLSKRRTTGKGVLVGVRLQPDILAILDSYIKEECSPGTSRPEALRTAFRDWAISMGYMR